MVGAHCPDATAISTSPSRPATSCASGSLTGVTGCCGQFLRIIVWLILPTTLYSGGFYANFVDRRFGAVGNPWSTGWSGRFAVRVIGRRSDMVFEGAEYLSCDINNYVSLYAWPIAGAVRWCILLPKPNRRNAGRGFSGKCPGTFNVFQAAAEEGICWVGQASSINATGQFMVRNLPPLDFRWTKITLPFQPMPIPSPSMSSKILATTLRGEQA